MAGGKAALPAPIDRPLSRAYLREFKGWSTEYPPGVSDSASLRVMENILITREGAAAVRPGLKLLTPQLNTFVGSFEPFYLNTGDKAYLVAVRDTGRVEFRVLVTEGIGLLMVHTLADIGFDLTAWGGDEPSFTAATEYVRYVQIDNKILALSNAGEPLIVFHVGETKRVPKIQSIDRPLSEGLAVGVTSAPAMGMPNYDWFISGQDDFPAFSTEYGGLNTLISSDPEENIYNFAFFYTYSNELGESKPSEIGQVRTKRPYGGWLWETTGVPAHGYGSTYPSGTVTSVATDCTDQLAIVIPNNDAGGFDHAVARGATKVNFYMMAWSVQGVVPVEAQLIGSRDLTSSSTAATHGWFVMNPGHQPMGPSLPIPTKDNRYNSTAPSKASQGLVAADRLVLVNDKTAAAVVRWTTNEQGNYLNFAPSRGGGYKTLTSGNMQVPACVKLWQNPQSADTLTILCMGTDGHSTSYYMAPASVTSQSDNTVVMGFEETTATQGTTSPYGCEVANNALYHPVDDQLVKSTASNYNINHKPMTDPIATAWSKLLNKDKIVSCFYDQRIYYLVHNPDGAALQEGCWGNELWVLDLAAETPLWSRWLVQGLSLKKIEFENEIRLAVVRPNGIYCFDPNLTTDDVRAAGEIYLPQQIPWKLETNTQGANRAHDAWAHLRQLGVTLGNFEGHMEYGIVGWDRGGQEVKRFKSYRQEEIAREVGKPFDAEDFLQGRPNDYMKEWRFYAHSVYNQPSAGQISLVQYRYTPASVNIGWEWGEVETFEYGQSAAGNQSYATNGIPNPQIDTRYP